MNRLHAWRMAALALPLAGCGLIWPKSFFYIASTDRPIRSASLRLCEKEFPLENVDGRFQASIRVPGDCDGAMDVMMADGGEVSCRIGYADSSPYTWRFEVRNGRCGGGIEIQVDYGANISPHHS